MRLLTAILTLTCSICYSQTFLQLPVQTERVPMTEDALRTPRSLEHMDLHLDHKLLGVLSEYDTLLLEYQYDVTFIGGRTFIYLDLFTNEEYMVNIITYRYSFIILIIPRRKIPRSYSLIISSK
jgi:hypothetical protein